MSSLLPLPASAGLAPALLAQGARHCGSGEEPAQCADELRLPDLEGERALSVRSSADRAASTDFQRKGHSHEGQREDRPAGSRLVIAGCWINARIFKQADHDVGFVLCTRPAKGPVVASWIAAPPRSQSATWVDSRVEEKAVHEICIARSACSRNASMIQTARVHAVVKDQLPHKSIRPY
ncbi:hypothetical protein BDZ88DRAFT_442326 [Geranomyces variabilis]|nr:hypothetical protein BDZ88DRAFT_442326 [Geranomyces variabilis]